MRLRTGIIVSYAEAADEYIQIGGASIIDLSIGSMLVVTESLDDIQELISQAEKVSA
jgi:hypothetical protein